MNTPVGPSPSFSAHLETVVQRVTPILGACGHDSLVIHSGTQRLAFLDDQSFPLRSNPHFLWWVPLRDSPDCLLQFTPGRKPVLVFQSADDFWHKPAQLPDAAWTQCFDIRAVNSADQARTALDPVSGLTAFIGEPFDGLADFGVSSVNPPQLLRRLHEQRVHKTPYEIDCLRAASLLGARGHLAAQAAFHQGGSEFAIHQAFLDGCTLREQELPYQAIVALNDNCATLHYQQLERRAPAERHSMLIDAGAQHHGYASDITRTYAAADGDFQALIDGMEALQQSLCAAVRPGIDWRELHLTTHQLLAELLIEQQLIHTDAEQAVRSGLTSVFLPHGLGHLLGLQVHDVGGRLPDPDGPQLEPPAGHQYLRLTRVLEPGFVVTMEPGLYFIDSLLEKAMTGQHGNAINWRRVQALRSCGGIRIEDNLVITADGCENLTRDAFQLLETAHHLPD
ncbi:MAG: Xaa-Pro dipeptidase [Proteobacteria bacterium]|nr:Xaa-Pro dipeptidase [Pseudomonadota bacterium]